MQGKHLNHQVNDWGAKNLIVSNSKWSSAWVVDKRMCLSPRMLVIPFISALSEYALILTNLTTLSQTALVYIIKSFQMSWVTLDSCHCSWLKSCSLCSIQKLQGRMPRRRRWILILTRKLWILPQIEFISSWSYHNYRFSLRKVCAW